MFGRESIIGKRVTELAAMLMIGDGMLALLEPRRHVLLWHQGPGPWRRMMQPFVERPGLTRLFGALEAGAGAWLASRQKP